MNVHGACSRAAILSVMLLMLGTVGCDRGVQEEDDGRLKIVTALFPSYDFARRIGGEDADVTLLLSPGVEAHGFEPTPHDIIEMHDADIVLYWGAAMEPWMADVVRQWGGAKDGPVVVDLSDGVDLQTAEVACTHPGHDHSHHHTAIDPHYWLDPVICQSLVREIAAVMGEKDPEHADAYAERAEAYVAELADLDVEIRETLERCPRKKLVYGDHFTFGYFIRRYGLEHVSPYEGASPDAAPSAKAVAEMAEQLKDDDVRAVYYQKLTKPGVARVLAEEAGLDLVALHALQNVSQAEMDGGATYISLMEENLQQLRKGLGAEEQVDE